MRRLIVGISGATGVQIGIRVLEALQTFEDVETHLVMSEGAQVILARECAQTHAEVESLADVVHENRNLAATISSGSFVTDGMIVGKRKAARIVGGEKKLESLTVSGAIECQGKGDSKNGKWRYNLAQVLRHCRPSL